MARSFSQGLMANLMSRTFNPQFKLTLKGAGKENVEAETIDPCDFQHAVATIFFFGHLEL